MRTLIDRIEGWVNMDSDQRRSVIACIDDELDNLRKQLAERDAAIAVLAEECVTWRKWERECSAMAVMILNKQHSEELAETADKTWMEAGGDKVNRTNANPLASAAVAKAKGPK